MKLNAALDALRTTMRETQKFDRAWDRFFDLTAQPKFITASRRSTLEHLEPVVHAICKIMVADPKGIFRLPAVLRYARSDFYHGIIQSARQTGSFMYFKNLDSGMVVIVNDVTRKTDFCRFALAAANSPHSFVAPSSDTREPVLH